MITGDDYVSERLMNAGGSASEAKEKIRLEVNDSCKDETIPLRKQFGWKNRSLSGIQEPPESDRLSGWSKNGDILP